MYRITLILGDYDEKDDDKDDDVITVNHSGDLIPMEHLDNRFRVAEEEESEEEENGDTHLPIEANALCSAIGGGDGIRLDQVRGENPEDTTGNTSALAVQETPVSSSSAKDYVLRLPGKITHDELLSSDVIQEYFVSKFYVNVPVVSQEPC